MDPGTNAMTLQQDTARKGWPLVAVVTPVYNGRAFMERTLRSVQNQTYPNIVHVILDNASEDETPELIRSVMNGRVPVLTRRNETVLNQIANWNAAMAMTPADTKYVKLLPADDLMRADCIEKMVDLAESDPEIDFVHAIDVFNDVTKPHSLDPQQQIYDGPDYARRWLRGEVTWISAAHVFFRVTPERLREPYSPDGYSIFDLAFIFRALLNRKMGFIFEPLLYTRYDDATVTSKSGGYRPSMFSSYALLLRKGPALFERKDFERLRRIQYAKVLRHMLAWRYTGHSAMTTKALEGLAKEGYRPSLLDYVHAVLSWPGYKIARMRQQRMRGELENPTAVPESEFLRSADTNRHKS
jgi:glycosyltransferase involved in cell wall biosynthesis